ncbi:hypothetical protein ZIOFF_047289 [Zingiber officinale]|uniref:Zinc finger LSD1-type domain-containing protein n=1 Tax=Zingiber officinale TaxID=94328 RepID=A0A8J5KVK2_ZINOF|nr:hypothetical protein ZIOFF_047289 [Zingiber officinale]
MQSQVVCSGCRTVLLYPRGATEVRCAICSTITPAASGTSFTSFDISCHKDNSKFNLTGMDMSQLVCGGCRTMLMYTRGATSVRCSCCNTINITMSATI